MGRREAETRARSGPRLVVYFPREHFFFFPLLEKVFSNSAGYYWQAERSCRSKPGLEFRKLGLELACGKCVQEIICLIL